MLIDGHAHLHRCHPVEAALDAALENLARAGPAAGAAPEAAMLWLVAGRGEGGQERLLALESERWRRSRRDAVTWVFHRVDGTSARLIVVLGRQIRTEEDLEVLVVGTTKAPADGRPLLETVEAWLDRDVLVMLPWGFGKWSGARGRLVERAFERYAASGLRLADTGARTSWLPEPRLFRRSRSEGRPVLVGSDPFPFPDRLTAIGSTGFAAPGIPPEATWPTMLSQVRALKAPVERFGPPLGTFEFGTLQARMQLRKRLGRG